MCCLSSHWPIGRIHKRRTDTKRKDSASPNGRGVLRSHPGYDHARHRGHRYDRQISERDRPELINAQTEHESGNPTYKGLVSSPHRWGGARQDQITGVPYLDYLVPVGPTGPFLPRRRRRRSARARVARFARVACLPLLQPAQNASVCQ